MNMRKTTILLFLALGALLVQSCKKTDYEKIEQDTIREFLKQNDITAEPTESGLYYIEKEAGTGLQPVDSDTVSINYIAYKLTGLVFDTNIESVANSTGYTLPQEVMLRWSSSRGQDRSSKAWTKVWVI